MPQTKAEKRNHLIARKEQEARVRAEANAGTFRPPPPLLAGLTPLSEIAPRVLSQAQQKRNRAEQIDRLKRLIKNCTNPTERAKLEQSLAELRNS